MKTVPPTLFRHPLFQRTQQTLASLGIHTLRFQDNPNLNQSCLVALSGGADSVALLRVLLLLGIPCQAVHCNFHLRNNESYRDQQFVQQLCNRLGVTLHIKEFNTTQFAEQQKLSIELAARNLRYTYFEQLVSNHNFSYVALGHHLGDNIETLLQHLAEGCGMEGIRGIPLQRGVYIRPLLNCTKAEIESFLALLNQPFVTDSTNNNTQIQRNYIRHQLAPQLGVINPSYEDALRRTFENLREAEKLTQYALSELVAKAQLNTEGTIFDAIAIAQSPAPLSLLYAILAPLGFARSEIQRFTQTLLRPDPATIYSPTHGVRRKGRKLFIFLRNE